MPWKHTDAQKHTHLADTPARQRQWSYVANGVLAKTGDEAQAIETANGVLKAHPSMKEEPAHNSGSKSAPPAASVTARKSALGVGMKPHSPAKHWSGH
jgi:hypothetical protein